MKNIIEFPCKKEDDTFLEKYLVFGDSKLLISQLLGAYTGSYHFHSLLNALREYAGKALFRATNKCLSNYENLVDRAEECLNYGKPYKQFCMRKVRNFNDLKDFYEFCENNGFSFLCNLSVDLQQLPYSGDDFFKEDFFEYEFDSMLLFNRFTVKDDEVDFSDNKSICVSLAEVFLVDFFLFSTDAYKMFWDHELTAIDFENDPDLFEELDDELYMLIMYCAPDLVEIFNTAFQINAGFIN